MSSIFTPIALSTLDDMFFIPYPVLPCALGIGSIIGYGLVLYLSITSSIFLAKSSVISMIEYDLATFLESPLLQNNE